MAFSKRDFTLGFSAALGLPWLLEAKKTAAADLNQYQALRNEADQYKALLNQYRATIDQYEALLNQAKIDKDTAVSQMAAQTAASDSDIETQGFTTLAGQYSWLKNIRKSIGQMNVDDGWCYGSAVLLDRYGTLVMAGHELPKKKASLILYPAAGKGTPVPVNNFIYDQNHDLMFATINPSIITEFGLQPLPLGQLGYTTKEQGREIVSVGWASPSMRLHATKGAVIAFNESISLVDNLLVGKRDFLCKTSASNVSFGGMSGGPALWDGFLIGITSTLSALGIHTFNTFTPVDFIRAAYNEFYPERSAAFASFTPLQASSSETPEACRFERRNFLKALLLDLK